MEQQYLDLCKDVLQNGEYKADRTGTGTLSVFDRQLKFDLMEGFPAITTKKLFIKAVWHELLWMLKGTPSIKYLKDNNVKIWNEWADENNSVGPVYGVQWRRWRVDHLDREEHIDQLAEVIERIKTNPADRRLLVTAWNPSDIHLMGLPPCHYAYQFYVRKGVFLDCKVHQRSADVFLGLPFDIASYATLVHMIAHLVGLRPGVLTYDLGDTHIYTNHIDQVYTQIGRRPYTPPKLEINVHGREIKTIDDFEFSDFAIIGYNHHPSLRGAVSV